MHEFLSDLNLMPFHLSLVVLLLISTLETIGYYFNFRPSQLIKSVFSQRITESPLLDVKFSKVLIFVFLLMNFSVSGYFLQFFIYSQKQHFVPAYYIIFPAFIIAIFFTVFMIHCLDQVIKPKYSVRQVALCVMSLGNCIMCRLNLNLVNLNFKLKSLLFAKNNLTILPKKFQHQITYLAIHKPLLKVKICLC